MYLYFIRHGQSENNALWDQTKSNHGRSEDPNLTKVGENQAICLADYLFQHRVSSYDQANGYNRNGFFITHIYTSLMHRAVSTANQIASKLEMPFYGRLDLHEWGGVYLDDPETNIPVGLPALQNRR